jgi:IS605 OrfB family transposase
VEHRRTAVVKLDVTDEGDSLLYRTVQRYKQAANIAVDAGWNVDGRLVTSKNELHHRSYERAREATDGLNADLVQTARTRAADALNGCVIKREKGENPSKPRFTSDTVAYNKNAITYYDDYATLATVDGRVEARFVLPDDPNSPQQKYLCDGWERKEATLHHRDGDWYLHISVVREDDFVREEAENGTVLGVDLGVKNLAVTSTGQFWSGGTLNHRRREYERVRGNLQQTGTESAHRTIEQIGDRETRWAEEYLHRVSKAIVQEALANDCDTIALEDLTDIRDRMPGAKKFHCWAFRRLYEFVAYKAAEQEIVVEQIDPAYTSQRCSKCGTSLEENRDGEAFECLKCGYEVHADYNAAKNVGHKLLSAGQKSPSGGVTRQLALKSGTLNANGEFTPASSEA